MDEDELKELQDPNTWQDMEDDKRPPVKPSRVIVSVAFPRSDFDLVSEAADEHGMKMSEFVRNAAIERARATVAESVAVSLSGDVRNGFSLTQGRAARIGWVTTKSDSAVGCATASTR